MTRERSSFRASGAAVVSWRTVDGILEASRPGRAAAIVLATHGRGGLRRLVLGSVADKLVRVGEVPVLVCRPAGRGKRQGRAGVRRAATDGRR